MKMKMTRFNLIKPYREMKGLTQKELGALIGVSKAVISHWECQVHQPSYENVIRLSIALMVEPKDFIKFIR